MRLLALEPRMTGPIFARPPARIEIEPVAQRLRAWALVSATNDDTQHVTAILPAQ